MRAARQDIHGDWLIEVFRDEDYPAGWTPGDPHRYRAWGQARQRSCNGGSQQSSAPPAIRTAPAHFADFNSAYLRVKTALVAQIAVASR